MAGNINFINYNLSFIHVAIGGPHCRRVAGVIGAAGLTDTVHVCNGWKNGD